MLVLFAAVVSGKTVVDFRWANPSVRGLGFQASDLKSGHWQSQIPLLTPM